MNDDKLAFTSGLLGGFVDSALDEQKRKRDERLKTLSLIVDQGDETSRQQAFDEIVGMVGLSPKGKSAGQYGRVRGLLEGVSRVAKGMAGIKGKKQQQQGGDAGPSADLGNVPESSQYRLRAYVSPEEAEQKKLEAQFNERKREANEIDAPAAEQQHKFRMEEAQAKPESFRPLPNRQVKGAAILSRDPNAKDKEGFPIDPEQTYSVLMGNKGSTGYELSESIDKPSKYDQYAKALLQSGKAKTPEEAMGMAVDESIKAAQMKVKDIQSRIAKRSADVAKGASDLTRVEKAKVSELESDMRAKERELAREVSMRAKEPTRAKQASHDDTISDITEEISRIHSEVDGILNKVQGRMGGGGGGLGDVPSRGQAAAAGAKVKAPQIDPNKNYRRKGNGAKMPAWLAAQYMAQAKGNKGTAIQWAQADGWDITK